MWLGEFEVVAVGCEGGFCDDGVGVGVDAPVADEFVYVEGEGTVKTAEFFDVPVVALVVGGDGDSDTGTFAEEAVGRVQGVFVVWAECSVTVIGAVGKVDRDVLHFGPVFELHHLVSHTYCTWGGVIKILY